MAIDNVARGMAAAALNSGGGGGEPEAYIKNASVSGSTLTLTKKDNSTVTFSDTNTTYTAGTNVSIDANNQISATDTTYTAGTNVDITNGVISATDTVYSLPTASTSVLGGVKVDGSTITISDGVISSSGGGTSLNGIANGTGTNSILIGDTTNSSASGNYSLAVGNTIVTSNYAAAIGYGAWAGNDGASLAVGEGSVRALGNSSLAIGQTYSTSNSGSYIQVNSGTKGSIAGGKVSNYNGQISNAGSASIIFGYQGGTTGASSTQMGNGSALFYYYEGDCRSNGSLVTGYGVTSRSEYAMVNGKYNIADNSTTYVRIVGNGSSTTPANAYTLDWTGNATFAGTVTSSGSDYAEYFEWLDGNQENEDRVGYIVKLNGDKIELANEGDDILGIISGTATVLGDNQEWNWQGKFLTDDFGRIIYDLVEDVQIEFDEETNEEVEVTGNLFPQPRLNPNYDENREYINRRDRAEWDAVGMMGKLYVRDDGTANVNDYVKPSEGIATKAEERTNMRVIERVSENIIRVVLK